MVTLLFRKMLRDMRRSAMAYGICIGIAAVGICGYCVLSIAADQLARSADSFYEKTSFPQIFAEVESAPLAVEDRLARITGVERAEGRIVETARVTGSGYGEETELLLLSVMEGGLSVPLLSQGSAARPGEMELAAGDGFCQVHGLKAGDTLKLVIRGKTHDMDVAGRGISPENSYLVKTIADLLPDPGSYDAAFVSRETMEKLTGELGRGNSFVLSLKPGASQEKVMEQVEAILMPYGCRRVYDRTEQFSASMLETELEQLRKVSEAIPFLFLAVAAVILSIALHRLVQQQRVTAGTMLAMGVRGRVVCLHYAAYGAFAGFAGGVIGGAAGYLCAEPLVDFYRIYFRLPETGMHFSFTYLFGGVLLATVFCTAVGWGGARRLSGLSPAEALKPEAPPEARDTLVDRIAVLRNLFTLPGMMALRGMARSRRRTVVSLFGIACAFMITASLASMNSLFQVYLFDDLEKTQRQDLSVNFDGPVDARDALFAVRDPQLELAEGVLEFAVNLKGPQGTMDGSVKAIPEDSRLCRLYEESGREIFVQGEGIVLSRHAADLLGAGIGDWVTAETVYPDERERRTVVTGITAQYLGSTAYVSLGEAERISGMRNAFTSMLLKGPPQLQQRLTGKLSEAQRVTLIENRIQRVEKYHRMMGSMEGLMGTMAGLGVLIGFAVVYIGSLISFEEKKRELAALRMLGMSEAQCLDVISTSQWFLTAGGILLGIPMSMGASTLISRTMTSDIYTIPDFIAADALLAAAMLTAAATWLASRMTLRKIRALSAVDLLRERE